MSIRSAGFQKNLERTIGIAVLVFVVIAPLITSTPLMSNYFVGTILTQAFFLGIAASSLIFLSAYGGMVSLCQVSIYGIAGFALGNVVTNGNTKGLNLGWSPWVAPVLGIAIATAVALLLGALASRSAGIYFLMITLTFAVIANAFFGADLSLSGFGGISGIRAPWIGEVAAHQYRLYYVALVVAFAVYVLIRYLVRTPFGLTLQGVRDDAVRMSSLGYNVPLHRTLAFGFAGFVASLAGVLFVWWNGHIDPATINIGAAIDLLVMCVIGGLYRLEGAWLGAFVFVVLNNYLRSVPYAGHIGIPPERFHTLIGIVFLVIVLLSPGGLMGLWERLLRRLGGTGSPQAVPVATASADAKAAGGATAAGEPGG
ncbi:MAG: branched-chain amino acid ABC transporter permease [Candidatus Rokuibacteriota bacterium]|nr:MAG: branched-chain amino acid ABC transporter permease [Candidatus Rokubacteria bacterium]